ncbi:MAG: hypothetical protein M3326_12195, partial [Actinomycetota bacterium]|nr:hypothetical protein [Actinomycetota bacterium]
VARSGDTGVAANGITAVGSGGSGGPAGAALGVSTGGAPVLNLLTLLSPSGLAAATGGSSVGTSAAGGGSGGTSILSAMPFAVSGDSGVTNAASTSTNTGRTGPATSGSLSGPLSLTGLSAPTGPSGSSATTSTPSATNTGILGNVFVLGGTTLLLP